MAEFTIEYNENYPKEQANMFLMHQSGQCVGGADKPWGADKWRVDVSSEWDGETDALLIGEYDTQEDAHAALWDNRYLAHIAA